MANEGREVSARIGRQRDLEGIDAMGELGRERFEGRHGHGRPLGGWGSSPVKASAELLENTFDRPERAPGFSGDLGHGVTVDPEPDDDPIRFG